MKFNHTKIIQKQVRINLHIRYNYKGIISIFTYYVAFTFSYVFHVFSFSFLIVYKNKFFF
jgi:hypothetical protein